MHARSIDSLASSKFVAADAQRRALVFRKGCAIWLAGQYEDLPRRRWHDTRRPLLTHMLSNILSV